MQLLGRRGCEILYLGPAREVSLVQLRKMRMVPIGRFLLHPRSPLMEAKVANAAAAFVKESRFGY
jgi:hypothetical protein